MTTATKRHRRGSSVVGALVGAVLGGLISLGVVFISFGRQTVHVENLMTAVNGADGKDGPDGLKARVGNLDDRVLRIETTPQVQGNVVSPQAIRREIETFCERYPERCGAAAVQQLQNQLASAREKLDELETKINRSGDGSDSAVENAQIQEIEKRLDAVEATARITPLKTGDIRVVQPGQLILDEDAVAFHLKKSDRKSSSSVRVELQLVPARDVRVAFHPSSRSFIRAVDMQGREYAPDSFTYAGEQQSSADLLGGTVVPLVLNYSIPAEENTIRTIKMTIQFDNGAWQEIETPAIPIAE